MLEHIDANKDTIATHPRMLGMVSVAKDVSYHRDFEQSIVDLTSLSPLSAGIACTTLLHPK